MPQKIFGIPLREFITICIMILGIATAWATSKADIESLKRENKAQKDEVATLRGELIRIEDRLYNKIDRIESILLKSK